MALIYEPLNAESKKTKAIIFSVKNINSLELVKKYNPYGTKKTAKFIIDKPITEAEKKIINEINKNITKLPI